MRNCRVYFIVHFSYMYEDDENNTYALAKLMLQFYVIEHVVRVVHIACVCVYSLPFRQKLGTKIYKLSFNVAFHEACAI